MKKLNLFLLPISLLSSTVPLTSCSLFKSREEEKKEKEQINYDNYDTDFVYRYSKSIPLLKYGNFLYGGLVGINYQNNFFSIYEKGNDLLDSIKNNPNDIVNILKLYGGTDSTGYYIRPDILNKLLVESNLYYKQFNVTRKAFSNYDVSVDEMENKIKNDKGSSSFYSSNINPFAAYHAALRVTNFYFGDFEHTIKGFNNSLYNWKYYFRNSFLITFKPQKISSTQYVFTNWTTSAGDKTYGDLNIIIMFK